MAIRFANTLLLTFLLLVSGNAADQWEKSDLELMARQVPWWTTPDPDEPDFRPMEEWHLHIPALDGEIIEAFWNLTRAEVYGDPHIQPLDPMSDDDYLFHGTCTYVVAKSCNTSLEQFRVFSKFHYADENQRQSKVSSPRNVIVDVYDYEIRIDQGQRIYVQGLDVLPPVFIDLSGSRYIAVFHQCGYGMAVVTDFGLLVLFNGARTLYVYVPSDYRSNICGLIGNFDGFDEFEGFSDEDFTDFGNFWKDDALSHPDCENANQSFVTCTSEQEVIVNEQCATLNDEDGVFGDCLKYFTGSGLHWKRSEIGEDMEDACRYDMCADFGNEEFLCSIYEQFARVCQRHGFTVQWRSEEFCDPSCPENGHYEYNVVSCEGQCERDGSSPDCPQGTNGGGSCVCDDGYARQGEECLLPAQLGCQDANGFYHKQGDTWSETCIRLCTCVAHDVIDCVNSGCPPTWDCVPQPTGPDICACANPLCAGVCEATHDGHLRTPFSLGKLIPASTRTELASIMGPPSNPCKVRISVGTNKDHYIGSLEIAIGVRPKNVDLYYKRYILDLWSIVGLVVAGHQTVPAEVEIPEDGYFDGNGEYSIQITALSETSYNIKAFCHVGMGFQIMTVDYAVSEEQYFFFHCNQPLWWNVY